MFTEENLYELGTVILIDDNWPEIEPIVNYLISKKVPFKYYNGNEKKVPSNKEAARLVFLDLVLNGSGVFDATAKGLALQTLQKALTSNNGPYYLLVWSEHEDCLKTPLGTHKKSFLDDLKEKNIYPIDYAVLEKSKLLAYGAKIGEYLQKEVLAKLNFPKGLSLLVEWQNCVNSVCRNTISTIFNESTIEDSSIMYVIKRLSNSLDNEEMSDQNRTLFAMETLNNILFSGLSTEIYTLPITELAKLINWNTPEPSPDQKAIIKNVLGNFHSAVRVIEKKIKSPITGGVYALSTPINHHERIGKFGKTSDGNIKKTYRLVNKIFTEHNDKIISCKVNFTPKCTRAQTKHLTEQYVYAYLIPLGIEDAKNLKADSLLRHIIRYDKKDYWLFVDFNMITNEDVGLGEYPETLFIFTESFIAELKQYISTYFNKIGMLDIIEA